MANKARKLTPQFVENAKDGEWPDIAVVGLVLCVTNGGKGKSWEYRFTSPTRFAEKDGKRKYKRRSKGLGSAKAAVGGVSLVEAREQAALYSRQVRDRIDPIDAERTAKFEQEVRAGEALTVFDAMEEYFRVNISHKPIDYRRRNRRHFDRIHKALDTVPIKTLAEHPEMIVDRLGMRERWHDHRDGEERVLAHLRNAINSVKRRCKITSNPAVVEDCLQYCGLSLERTKPRGHYKALPYQDVGRLMARIRGHVAHVPGDFPVGQRPTAGYLLEFIWLSTVRGGEVRQAQWKEFNEANGVWVAPVDHMKKVKGGARPRPVPITKPMQDILDAMRNRHRATTGIDPSPDDLVFPSPRPNKHGQLGGVHSRTALKRVLDRVWPEFQIHPHGSRTSIRTWARSDNKYPVYLVDRQQGRSEKGVGGTSYSSEVRPYLDDETLDQRRLMMEHWGRFCAQVDPPSAKVSDIATKPNRHRKRKS